MKRKNKIIALSAAAVILAGIGGGAYLLRNRGITLPDNPIIGEIGNPSGETNLLGLNLTATMCNPALRGLRDQEINPFFDMCNSFLAATEYGYYFTDNTVILDKDPDGKLNGGFRYGEPIICFTDKETGTTVPLCPRPNCLHDGSLFCTATTEAYAKRSKVIPADGYLYTTCIVEDDQKLLLLRYAPDGTEITELGKYKLDADFANEIEFGSNPVLHRGYLFQVIRCTRTNKDDAIQDAIFSGGGSVEIEQEGGFEVIACELATGKITKIYAAYPEIGGERPIQYCLPTEIFADGDALYLNYRYSNGGNAKPPAFDNGLNRLSLLTGELSFVDRHEAMVIANGYAYYTGNSKESAQKQMLYQLPLQGTEKAEAVVLDEIPDGQAPCIVADGTYIYVVYPGYAGRKTQLRVYDDAGNQLVCTEQLPEGSLEDMAVKDGVIYLRIREGVPIEVGGYTYNAPLVMEAEIADVIADTPTWTFAFSPCYLRE